MTDRDKRDRQKGYVKILPWYWIRTRKNGGRHAARAKAINRSNAEN